LIGFVGVFIDVDDPTDATGILAFGADATKAMIGPRLEPFDRLQHCLRIPETVALHLQVEYNRGEVYSCGTLSDPAAGNCFRWAQPWAADL
jgi:hypothetical protein